MKNLKFTLECDDYRVLQIPNSNGSKAKLGTMFVKVEDLHKDLEDWTDVNPRNPKFTRGGKLSGRVARFIVETLEEYPEKFALKNLGIYLLVNEVESARISKDRHTVTISLTDINLHGIVNGGHTFQAIRQVIQKGSYQGQAFVRLHLYQNIPSEQIVDLADGLNRNLQVTDSSLKNLQGKFENIKAAMKGKRGEDQIAYSEGEDGNIDILEVLHMLSLLDLTSYPDSDKHPNDIFGTKQKVLNRYIDDIEKEENSSFAKLIPMVHEILILSDEIQKRCSKLTGGHKVKNTPKSNRVASPGLIKNAYFSEGEFGFIPQGWLYPMLAAFRANISKKAWAKGRFEWLSSPLELLDEVIVELAHHITERNSEEKKKPGEVGRKPTAYKLCYFTVFTKLAMEGKIEIIPRE